MTKEGKELRVAHEPSAELASGGMARVVVSRRVSAAGSQRLVVIKRLRGTSSVASDFATFVTIRS